MSTTRRTRATAVLLGLTLAAGAAVAVDAQRTAATEQQLELAAARSELVEQVDELNDGVAAPARAARDAADELRLLAAEAITGSDRDPAEIRADLDRSLRQVRDTAEQLDAAADLDLPRRPTVLPVATVDPLFSRLAPLDEQVRTVADRLVFAVEDADRLADASLAIHEAGQAYADRTEELPDSDEPDAHLEAWRAEREHLAAYRDAVEQAGDTPGLEAVAEVHEQLVTALTELGDDAVAALEDDDVDAYNERLERGVDLDLARWQDELRQAKQDALDGIGIERIDDARAYVLGLLAELDGVRAEADATVAETA